MQMKRNHRHPLSRSLEHVIGIAGVFIVALVVGSYGSSIYERPKDQLAQTVGIIDTSLPTPPNTIRAAPLSQTQVEITWQGASDNSRIMGYRIFRDGSYFFGTTQTRYVDTSVLPSETHTYAIVTVDTANNSSAQSDPVSVTLPAADGSGGSPGVSVPARAEQLGEVGFSVTVSPAVSCDGDHPLTSVFFLVTKTEGGDFILNSDSGIANAQMEWGEYPLPNGNYTWRGRAKPGYVSVTDSSGDFIIASACLGMATSSTVVTTTTGGTTATELPIVTTVNRTPISTGEETGPPVLPRPQLKLFIKDRPADLSRSISTDDVELRVTTAVAKRVVFYREKPVPEREIGIGIQDDLLSIAGLDIYSYIWDPERENAGTIVIYARVFHEDGRTTETERITVTVVNATGQANTGTTPKSSTDVAASERVLTKADRETILSRLSDPSSCSNADECKIFCSSGGTRETCVDYAREETALRTRPASLADGVMKERLSVVLADNGRLPKELPETVRTPESFLRYCEDLVNAVLCEKTMVANDLAAPDSFNEKREQLKNDMLGLQKIFSERVGVRAYVDADGDSVPDYDEINLYRTSPVDTDTDRDGFPDGVELLARTNPRGGMPSIQWSGSSSGTPVFSQDESMMREDPRVAGIIDTTILSVDDVRTATVVHNGIDKENNSRIIFSGKAPPNAFVTLYIFSDPIVVAVKADHDGSWSYALDKDLSDGTHEIFSAITDSTGRIMVRSSGFSFVNDAGAVTLAVQPADVAGIEVGLFSGNGTVAILAVLLGLLGIALSIIGIIAARITRKEDHPPANN
jgi:hypothetical protein